jgi:hypothetical protein
MPEGDLGTLKDVTSVTLPDVAPAAPQMEESVVKMAPSRRARADCMSACLTLAREGLQEPEQEPICFTDLCTLNFLLLGGFVHRILIVAGTGTEFYT